VRTAFVILLLALPLSATGESQFARGKSAASAELHFVINVPRVLKLELLDHPRTLEVSAQDVALGHVTVRGLRLDIRANDRGGYRLRAQLNGGAFEGVEVLGLDAPLAAGREGAVVRMPPQASEGRAAPRAVEYIFRLERGAQPGVYRWPVTLSLESP
jgi:hypothetical protein